jgi:hypothetical protein
MLPPNFKDNIHRSSGQECVKKFTKKTNDFKYCLYPILRVLILALAGDILGLENEGGGVVRHSLGQAQQQVLPLPALYSIT